MAQVIFYNHPVPKPNHLQDDIYDIEQVKGFKNEIFQFIEKSPIHSMWDLMVEDFIIFCQNCDQLIYLSTSQDWRLKPYPSILPRKLYHRLHR